MFSLFVGLLLDSQGRRFVDELTTRDVVSAKIFEHCSPLKVDNDEEVAVALLTSF
jgi:aspartate oxidase